MKTRFNYTLNKAVSSGYATLNRSHVVGRSSANPIRNDSLQRDTFGGGNCFTKAKRTTRAGGNSIHEISGYGRVNRIRGRCIPARSVMQ